MSEFSRLFVCSNCHHPISDQMDRLELMQVEIRTIQAALILASNTIDKLLQKEAKP